MASEDLEVKIGANIDNLTRELKKSKAELSKFGNDVGTVFTGRDTTCSWFFW